MPEAFFVLIFLTVLIFQAKSQQTDCSCYTLGTLGSIDGESICNRKTLQCKCYPNVIGKNCDQCIDGYYNIKSGHGCTPCNCNKLSSKQNTCDQNTGQCSCKSGYTGFKCDRCDANVCNAHGSQSYKCGALENCDCFSNFEGKHCKRCKVNFYNIYKGCIPCSSCYQFIQTDIHTLFQYLLIIMKNIENIENHFQSHVKDYKNFVNRVQSLKNMVEELKCKCVANNSFLFSIQLLHEVSEECEYFNKEVIKFVDSIKNNFSYDILKQHLYYVYTNLTETENVINVCEEALQNATITSKSIHRYNKTITNIAKEATATAQKIENRVQHLLNSSANEALSVCNETCQLHESFTQKHQQILREISVFQSGIENTTRNIAAMEIYLEDLHNKTIIAKTKATINERQIDNFNIPGQNIVVNNFNEVKQSVQKVSTDVKNVNKIQKEIQVKEQLVIGTLKISKEKENKLLQNIENANLLNDRSDGALERVEKLKKKIEMAKENLLELEKLNNTMFKDVSQIRDKIDAVLNNSKEIKNIFKIVNSTIKFIKQADTNLSKTVQIVNSNVDSVNANLKIVLELEEEQNEISKILEEEYIKLENVKEQLVEINKSQAECEKNLTLMQEYLLIFKAFPTTKKQLDIIDKEVTKLENMMNTIDNVRQQKDQLKKEVYNIKEIIEGIPENDSATLCPSEKYEP